VYLIANVADSTGIANQPVHQFLKIYQNFLPGWLAMTLAVVLVVISQIKINVTNAYSGSLAWTNSFTRVTKHYPGRIVFLGVNLLIALILMEANMFSFLNTILGFYANCGMTWVVVVASDIVFNKYLLKLSPMKPEFRRGMLYAFNPVGLLLDAHRRRPVGDRLLRWTRGGDPAVLTAGGNRFGCGFAARFRDHGIELPMYDEFGNPSGEHLKCHVCHHDYERPDMMKCQTHDAHVCSLCLSTDKVADDVLPAQT
jgi:hypothetical protein